MKRYNEYNDSGIQWVGEIPSHWKVKKLKHNFIIKKEKSYEKDPTILSLTLNGIKIRDISNNDGQIASSYEGYIKIKKGDIVLNSMDLLRGFVDSSPYDGVISPAYSTLQSKKILSNQYYNRYIQIMYFNKFLYGLGEGVSQEHRWTLKNETLLNLPIIEPPIEEQIAIVEFLDKKTTEIETIITKKKEMIEKLKEYHQALVTEAVTKGLDENVETKDSGIDWIGDIPKHWNKTRLKFIASVIPGQSPNSDGYNTDGIGIPFLQGSSDFGDIFPSETTYSEHLTKVTEIGDILISVRAPVGELNKSDKNYCIGRGVGAIRNKENSVSDFLWYLLIAYRSVLDSFSTGTTFKAISSENIRNLDVVFPDIVEQELIVNFLNEKTNKINLLICKLNKQISNLGEFRQSLISDAVTGKIKID